MVRGAEALQTVVWVPADPPHAQMWDFPWGRKIQKNSYTSFGNTNAHRNLWEGTENEGSGE